MGAIDWEEARKVWTVTIQTGVLVVGMAVGYQIIRSDLNQQMKQGERQELQLKEMSLEIEKLEIDMKAQDIKLDDFHAVYERDFEKYIRDPRK